MSQCDLSVISGWQKCVIGYSGKPQMIVSKTYDSFCKIKQLHQFQTEHIREDEPKLWTRPKKPN